MSLSAWKIMYIAWHWIWTMFTYSKPDWEPRETTLGDVTTFNSNNLRHTHMENYKIDWTWCQLDTCHCWHNFYIFNNWPCNWVLCAHRKQRDAVPDTCLRHCLNHGLPNSYSSACIPSNWNEPTPPAKPTPRKWPPSTKWQGTWQIDSMVSIWMKIRHWWYLAVIQHRFLPVGAADLAHVWHTINNISFEQNDKEVKEEQKRLEAPNADEINGEDDLVLAMK